MLKQAHLQVLLMVLPTCRVKCKVFVNIFLLACKHIAHCCYVYMLTLQFWQYISEPALELHSRAAPNIAGFQLVNIYLQELYFFSFFKSFAYLLFAFVYYLFNICMSFRFRFRFKLVTVKSLFFRFCNTKFSFFQSFWQKKIKVGKGLCFMKTKNI